MFRITLSYVRYALSALSTVAFGMSVNQRGDLPLPLIFPRGASATREFFSHDQDWILLPVET